MTSAGLITVASKYGVRETTDSFIAALKRRGMSVMARFDHAAAAKAVGLELRPTEVLVFGDPLVGTLLMQDVPLIGIDLPLKVLLWQDGLRQTWLSYNDPEYLWQRHGASATSRPTAVAMSAALVALAREASGREEP
jgi:uncharacterized protein (DUF302 family)